MNGYLPFAKRVDAEMARNGYPRQCVARGDVIEESIADYETLLDAAPDERPLQRFLEGHPGMLAQEMSANCRWVLPHPDLGGKVVPDFMVARLDSTGVRWTLIELESPRALLFTGEGRPHQELSTGIRQIQDWRAWFAANRGVARRARTESGLGLIGVDHLAGGLVIIGRRADRTDRDRRLLRPLMDRERVLVRTYDWLVDEARNRIRFGLDLERARATACEDCDMPGRSFDAAREAEC